MNEQPLGPEDATIQITYLTPKEMGDLPPKDPPTALFTVRCKDQDMTEETLREVGAACLRVADRMRADQAPTR